MFYTRRMNGCGVAARWLGWQGLTIILAVVGIMAGIAFCDEIHDAAKAGDVQKVKSLLGANPELVNCRIRNSGVTPIHVAAQCGHKNVVEILMANKADAKAKVNTESPYRPWAGKTALQVAQDRNFQDIVQLLHDFGVKE